MRSEEGERVQTPGRAFSGGSRQLRAAQQLLYAAQKTFRVLLKAHFFTQVVLSSSVAAPRCNTSSLTFPPPQFPSLNSFLNLLVVEEKASTGELRGVLNHRKWREGIKKKKKRKKKCGYPLPPTSLSSGPPRAALPLGGTRGHVPLPTCWAAVLRASSEVPARELQRCNDGCDFPLSPMSKWHSWHLNELTARRGPYLILYLFLACCQKMSF